MKRLDCFCTLLLEICVDKFGTSVIYQVYCESFSCFRVVGTCEQKSINQRRGGNRWVQFWKSSNVKGAINISKRTGNMVQVWQSSINSTFYPHCIYVLYLSENKQRLVSLNTINWFVFITEMKSVYGAVRTGSLNKAVCASSLKLTGYVMHHHFNIQ